MSDYLTQIEEINSSLHDPIIDNDSPIEIDMRTKEICIPADFQKTIALEGETNSNIITFIGNRYVDGHDLSKCARVYISWENVNAKKSDNYIASVSLRPEDEAVPDEDKKIIIPWVIESKIAQKPGPINFQISFIDYTTVEKFKDTGNIDAEGNNIFVSTVEKKILYKWLSLPSKAQFIIGESLNSQKDSEIVPISQYELGIRSEYDRFWDEYQVNGERKKYFYGFSGLGWTDQTYNPKYAINAKANESSGIFYESGISDTKVPIKLYKGNYNDGTVSQVFYGCKKLKTIYELELEDITVITNGSTNLFKNCVALENITIKGVIEIPFNLQDSPLLSDKSIQSIIDCLKDLTDLEAKKLTFHKTAIEKLTSNQKAVIKNKNWQLYSYDPDSTEENKASEVEL